MSWQGEKGKKSGHTTLRSFEQSSEIIIKCFKLQKIMFPALWAALITWKWLFLVKIHLISWRQPSTWSLGFTSIFNGIFDTAAFITQRIYKETKWFRYSELRRWIVNCIGQETRSVATQHGVWRFVHFAEARQPSWSRGGGAFSMRWLLLSIKATTPIVFVLWETCSSRRERLPIESFDFEGTTSKSPLSSYRRDCFG